MTFSFVTRIAVALVVGSIAVTSPWGAAGAAPGDGVRLEADVEGGPVTETLDLQRVPLEGTVRSSIGRDDTSVARDASQSFTLDVDGSLSSVFGVLGLLVGLFTVSSMLINLWLMLRRKLPPSRLRDDQGSQHEVTRLESMTGGTLTFAFSDIECSTEMAQAMGDRKWFEALTAHNTIIEGLVGDFDGSVIKSVGDGFMLTFPGATQASRCAIAIQRAITEHAVSAQGRAVKVRIGLHTGEAIAAGGDLFGTHVNIAARVANQAAGGQILLSSITRAIAQPSGELTFGDEQNATFKGLAGTHSVSELFWEPVKDDPSPLVPTQSPSVHRSPQPPLAAHHRVRRSPSLARSS